MIDEGFPHDKKWTNPYGRFFVKIISLFSNVELSSHDAKLYNVDILYNERYNS